MELLSVLSLFLLTCSTPTSAQQSGPAASRLVVKEDQQAVLLCSLGSSDITEQVFNWKNARKAVFFYEKGRHYNNGLVGQDPQFKGRVSHYPEQLASGNASILLRKAEVRDSGSYTCDFPSSQPARRAHVELIVDPILKDRTEEKIPGAVSKPSVKNLKQTDDSALLQCVVRGASPKPVVVWKDSSGKVVPDEEPEETEREGKYDIVLQTTVTKSDNYTCEATQEEINHQTSDWTLVFFSNSSTGLVVALSVVGTLFVGVLLLLAVLFHKGLLKCNKGSERSSSAPVGEPSNDAALPLNAHSRS